MGISIALDELLATGWSGMDSTGCSFDDSGRAYPSVQRVRQEFSAAGFELALNHNDKFKVYGAEWREAGSRSVAGSVISSSQEEAAVYALAQMRKSLVAA
jgi:hypothetical protein